MRFLVSGSAGFIGTAIVCKLLSDPENEVVGIDSLDETLYSNTLKLEKLSRVETWPNFKFYKMDLNEISTCSLDPSDFDYIINLAAIPGLNPSWKVAEKYFASNTSSVHNLMLWMAKNPNLKLVHASTSSVYGAIADSASNPTCVPISPYGVTKLLAEEVIKNCAQIYKTQFMILRLFSVYGPGQRPDMAIGKFIKAASNNEVIKVFGDGKQIRSFTFIDDIVDAFSTCIKKFNSGEILDISSNRRISLIDLVENIARLTGSSPEIEFCGERLGDQLMTMGNTARTTTIIGWTARTTIEDGLRRQIYDPLGLPSSKLQLKG